MTTKRQPYVGPRPYERNEADLFFGRNREADDLLSYIVSHNELLFYAQSGVGKTSLLKAKVIPMLEELNFEVLLLERVQNMIPQNMHPAEIQNIYIFNTLIGWAKDSIDPQQLAKISLTEFLKARPSPVNDDEWPSPRAIIFDQFEELFTLYSDRWSDRKGFFEQVRDALEDNKHSLRVVFTIREDFIAQLDPFASLFPERLRIRFRLERLHREAALSAVTEPLKKTRCSFAPGIAEKLVDDLLKTKAETVTGETVEIPGEFVEPVYLQIVCQNLWQEVPQNATQITEEHLRAIGNLDYPLIKFYESCISAAAAQTNIHEHELRQWCQQWLITSTNTRGLVHRDPGQTTKGIPNDALSILENKHLIHSEWRASGRWYELTHDRLIAPIRASYEEWNKQRTEKLNLARLLLDQAEHSNTEQKYSNAQYPAKQALTLGEECGDYNVQVTAHLNIGDAYHGMMRDDDAQKEYSNALQIANYLSKLQKDVYLLGTIAWHFADKKLYDLLIQCYSSYIELLPDDADLYYYRSSAYLRLKNYKQALADLNRVLELNSQYVNAYNIRGMTHTHLQNYEKAFNDYYQALELDPHDAYTYLCQGYTYLYLKNSEQAKIHFARSCEEDPKNVNAAWMAEYSAMDIQRPSIEMERRLREIAAFSPLQAESHICKGVALALGGRYKEGLEELELSILMNQETQDSYFWKGMIYAYMKKSQEAIESVQKSLDQELPPILLKPLYWLKKDNPDFYEKHAASLLAQSDI